MTNDPARPNKESLRRPSHPKRQEHLEDENDDDHDDDDDCHKLNERTTTPRLLQDLDDDGDSKAKSAINPGCCCHSGEMSYNSNGLDNRDLNDDLDPQNNTHDDDNDNDNNYNTEPIQYPDGANKIAKMHSQLSSHADYLASTGRIPALISSDKDDPHPDDATAPSSQQEPVPSPHHFACNIHTTEE
jgi:hypothetical protein